MYFIHLTYLDAIALVKSEVSQGNLLGFYTVPETHTIIGISDQGEFVFWKED